MATLAPVAVSTTTPVDVVAERSLTIGARYGMQYQGVGALNIRESDSAATPAITATASRATAADALELTPRTGEGIWIWVASGPARIAEGSQVVLWEK